MRFLGIGETIDLGDMYLRLIAAGHDVRVFVGDENSRDVMAGMVELVSSWHDELDWIRDAGDDGIIVFESATMGESQDELRTKGFHVVGGSALGDRLENDRVFGQKVLRDHGLRTLCSRSFESFDDGIAFLRRSPGKYVLKLNGANWASFRNYVGQMDSAEDMIALLEVMRGRWAADDNPSFILMEFVEGVEIGTGAFFNGERFLDPPNLDWEHKRFFPGDVGELTGEMGTVVTYRGAQKIFDASLRKLEPMLRESGYCGYINLNTIVNEDGIWPLELTSRFGYPGFAILDSLHVDDWASILRGLVTRQSDTIRTKDGFSVGVVITVPPFPYSDGYEELGKGTPVCFRDTITNEDRASLHFGEVALADEQLVTAGMIGYVMVVTGVGTGIEEARRVAYERVDKVVIPNARHRRDIGERVIDRDWSILQRLGWVE